MLEKVRYKQGVSDRKGKKSGGSRGEPPAADSGTATNPQVLLPSNGSRLLCNSANHVISGNGKSLEEN